MGRWEGGEDLEGPGGGKIIIRIYFMKKIFSIKKEVKEVLHFMTHYNSMKLVLFVPKNKIFITVHP